MEDQIGSTFYKNWKGLLHIRNKAVHYSNADFNDLKLFLDLLFDYLKNFRNMVSGVSDFVEPTPVKGRVYESKIHTKSNDWTYQLLNPGLQLEDHREFIILNTNARVNDKLKNTRLKKGDRIRFTLGIDEMGIRISYYANNAILIKS